MTREEILGLQGILFQLANGGAVLYPPAAPFVAGVEAIVLAAEQLGIKPVHISAEQLASIMAGHTAAQASAVTTVKERLKREGKL